MTAATQVESVGAWMVPIPVWEDVKRDIDALKAQWDGTVQGLAESVDDQVNALCEKFPDDAAGIRAFAPTAASFASSARFIFGAYGLKPEQIIESAAMAAEFDELPLQVLSDLGKMIKDQRKDLNQSGVYAASTRDFLEILADKASGFAFLHPRLGEIGQVIATFAGGLSRTESVRGDQARQVRDILDKLLGSSEALLRDGLAIGMAESVVGATVDATVGGAAAAQVVQTNVPAAPAELVLKAKVAKSPKPKVKVHIAPKAQPSSRKREDDLAPEESPYNDDLDGVIDTNLLHAGEDFSTDFLCV